MNLIFIIIWNCADVFDIFIRYYFHPYCLPDSALRSIKHAAAFQLLFTSGMVRSITEIVYTDENGNRKLFCDKVCDIYSKRKISALMISHKFTVYVYVTDLVNGSEMKEKLLAVYVQTSFRKLDNAGIPQDFVRKKLSVYLRKWGFR